jgi:hypothetical protein
MRRIKNVAKVKSLFENGEGFGFRAKGRPVEIAQVVDFQDYSGYFHLIFRAADSMNQPQSVQKRFSFPMSGVIQSGTVPAPPFKTLWKENSKLP